MRIETVINSPDDLRCHRRLAHLDELQARARAVNRRLLDTERVGQGCVLASPAFSGSHGPPSPSMQEGPGLTVRRPSGPSPGRRPMHNNARRHRHHQQEPARLDDRPARRHRLHHQPGQLRPGPTGSTGHPPHPGKNRYRLTGDGLRFAIFYTKLHDRLLRPLPAADQPPAPPPLRKALTPSTFTSLNASTGVDPPNAA